MTTTQLSKHYGTLTADERMPMLAAASVRGDESEIIRLTQSAPRIGYLIPDYFPKFNAFQVVIPAHLCERLNLGARLCIVSGLVEVDDSFWESLPTMARRYLTEIEGWALFCRELGIDPEGVLSTIPAADLSKALHDMATKFAGTPDEADAYWRKKRGTDSARLPTVEEIADSYRSLFRTIEETWH